MITEMGMICGPSVSLKSVFTWSLIFPDHLDNVFQMFRKNALWTDRPTNRPTDGRPPESLKSVFTLSLIFPDHLERISDVLKQCVTDHPTVGRME